MGLKTKKLHFVAKKNPTGEEKQCAAGWEYWSHVMLTWAIENAPLNSSPFLRFWYFWFPSPPTPVWFFHSPKKARNKLSSHVNWKAMSILPAPTLPQMQRLRLKGGEWLPQHCRWQVGLQKQLVPQYRTDLFWPVLKKKLTENCQQACHRHNVIVNVLQWWVLLH